MKSKKLYLSSVLVFLTFIPFQPNYVKPTLFTDDLSFLGKPIDPVCISEQGWTKPEEDIDLNECGMKENKYSFDTLNENLILEGFYGMGWKDDSIPNDTYLKGSSYYKVWDAGNHKYWVVTHYWGGGSGFFSSVRLLSRKNTHTITMDTMTFGDRCNGTVNNVIPAKNKFKYSIKITPIDFLDYSHDNSGEGTDGLNSCPFCCTADAYYEADTKGNTKFLYIDLSAHPKDSDPLNNEEPYQACFDDLIASYIRRGQLTLNEVQLKKFKSTFEEKCVRNQLDISTYTQLLQGVNPVKTYFSDTDENIFKKLAKQLESPLTMINSPNNK